MTIASGRSASSAQIVSARASAKTRHFMPAARHRRIIVSANRSPRSSFKEFSSYAGTANTPAQPARASRASRFSSPFSLPAESMEYHSNPAMRSFLPLRFRFHCTVSPVPRQAESAVCAHMINLPEETGHFFVCLVRSDEFPLFFLTFFLDFSASLAYNMTAMKGLTFQTLVCAHAQKLEGGCLI